MDSPFHNVDGCCLNFTAHISLLSNSSWKAFELCLFHFSVVLHSIASTFFAALSSKDAVVTGDDGDEETFITSHLYVLWWQCRNAEIYYCFLQANVWLSLSHCVSVYMIHCCCCCCCCCDNRVRYMYYTVLHFQMINRLTDHGKIAYKIPLLLFDKQTPTHPSIHAFVFLSSEKCSAKSKLVQE